MKIIQIHQVPCFHKQGEKKKTNFPHNHFVEQISFGYAHCRILINKHSFIKRY